MTRTIAEIQAAQRERIAEIEATQLEHIAELKAERMRKCQSCGKRFEGLTKRARYCSRLCMGRERMRRWRQRDVSTR